MFSLDLFNFIAAYNDLLVDYCWLNECLFGLLHYWGRDMSDYFLFYLVISVYLLLSHSLHLHYHWILCDIFIYCLDLSWNWSHIYINRLHSLDIGNDWFEFDICLNNFLHFWLVHSVGRLNRMHYDGLKRSWCFKGVHWDNRWCGLFFIVKWNCLYRLVFRFRSLHGHCDLFVLRSVIYLCHMTGHVFLILRIFLDHVRDCLGDNVILDNLFCLGDNSHFISVGVRSDDCLGGVGNNSRFGCLLCGFYDGCGCDFNDSELVSGGIFNGFDVVVLLAVGCFYLEYLFVLLGCLVNLRTNNIYDLWDLGPLALLDHFDESSLLLGTQVLYLIFVGSMYLDFNWSLLIVNDISVLSV